MEDCNLKNSSSLPSNYVSLLQLQKQWLEKEEERKRRELVQAEPKKQGEENCGKDNVKGKVGAVPKSASSRLKFDRDRRYRPVERIPSDQTSRRNAEEPRIEGVDIRNGAGKGGGLKNSRGKSKKSRARGKALLSPEKEAGESATGILSVMNERNKSDVSVKGEILKKSVVEENQCVDSANSLPEKDSKDINPAVEKVTGDRRLKSRKNRRTVDSRTGKSKLSSKKYHKDQTVQIEREFHNLALGGEREKNTRFRSALGGEREKNTRFRGWANGGDRRYNGGSWRFGRPIMQRQRDDGFVWVKKAETPNTHES